MTGNSKLVKATWTYAAAYGSMAVLLAVAPFFLPAFYTQLLAQILTYGIWASSFGLLMGQLGLTSFGHAAVFGGGAYAAAYVGLYMTPSLEIGLLAGAVIGAALGALNAFLLGRLNGVAFAIGTLAFGGMITQIANSWIDVTGGSDGLVGLPLPTLGFHRLGQNGLYWCSLALLGLAMFGTAALLRSQFGLLIHAARDNSTRATASGIAVYRVRIWTFAAAGLIAGAGGALFAYHVGAVAPSAVSWQASGDVLIMSILGGVRTLAGPVIGAVLFTLSEQLLSQVVEDYRILLGVGFILVVVLLPGGLLGFLKPAQAGASDDFRK